MQKQEKNFLRWSIVALLAAVLVVLAPRYASEFKLPWATESPLRLGADDDASGSGKIGIVVDGDNVGMEIDLSDALFVEDLTVGSGAEVADGDTVVIHYVGNLDGGEVFDSSRDRGEPLTVTIGSPELIQGLSEGLIGMKVGGKRRLSIPPSKAYGDQEQDGIPAGSTLHFDVELLEIVSE